MGSDTRPGRASSNRDDSTGKAETRTGDLSMIDIIPKVPPTYLDLTYDTINENYE